MLEGPAHDDPSAQGLCEAGYAVRRFDLTGVGDSGGDFRNKTVTRNVVDLVQAATALIQRGYGPCALVGHSLGGAASLLGAHRLKTVRSLAVIGAPASTHHVRHLLTDRLEVIKQEGVAEVTIAGRSFPVSRGFLADIERHDQEGRVAQLDRPLLVLHAIDDQTVDVATESGSSPARGNPRRSSPLLPLTISPVGRRPSVPCG